MDFRQRPLMPRQSPLLCELGRAALQDDAARMPDADRKTPFPARPAPLRWQQAFRRLRSQSSSHIGGASHLPSARADGQQISYVPLSLAFSVLLYGLSGTPDQQGFSRQIPREHLAICPPIPPVFLLTGRHSAHPCLALYHFPPQYSTLEPAAGSLAKAV